MIKITFSTMIELLEKEVEKEVNVDFNEVFQRMTLDAIGPYTFNVTSIATFSFNITLFGIVDLKNSIALVIKLKFQFILPSLSHSLSIVIHCCSLLPLLFSLLT